MDDDGRKREKERERERERENVKLICKTSFKIKVLKN
jgi:hypothetical protein